MSEQDTPKAAAKQVPERDYFVYEGGALADDANGKPSVPDDLKFVGQFTARTEKDARWAAIDASPSLKARATPQDGKEAEGVNLVAIAARYVGEPVLTREELDVRTVRR